MDNEVDPQALLALSYGMYIVTSQFEGKLNGQISNTVFQVTAEPPRLAVSINKDELTHEYISKSGVFGVCVLDESTPLTRIGLFGFKSGKEIDKFAQVPFEKGATGCPLPTENILAAIEVRVINQLDVGSHTLFIGDVVNAKVIKSGSPMTYAFYREEKKGKSPKHAPTYMPSA